MGSGLITGQAATGSGSIAATANLQGVLATLATANGRTSLAGSGSGLAPSFQENYQSLLQKSVLAAAGMTSGPKAESQPVTASVPGALPAEINQLLTMPVLDLNTEDAAKTATLLANVEAVATANLPTPRERDASPTDNREVKSTVTFDRAAKKGTLKEGESAQQEKAATLASAANVPMQDGWMVGQAVSVLPAPFLPVLHADIPATNSSARIALGNETASQRSGQSDTANAGLLSATLLPTANLSFPANAREDLAALSENLAIQSDTQGLTDVLKQISNPLSSTLAMGESSVWVSGGAEVAVAASQSTERLPFFEGASGEGLSTPLSSGATFVAFARADVMHASVESKPLDYPSPALALTQAMPLPEELASSVVEVPRDLRAEPPEVLSQASVDQPSSSPPTRNNASQNSLRVPEMVSHAKAGGLAPADSAIVPPVAQIKDDSSPYGNQATTLQEASASARAPEVPATSGPAESGQPLPAQKEIVPSPLAWQTPVLDSGDDRLSSIKMERAVNLASKEKLVAAKPSVQRSRELLKGNAASTTAPVALASPADQNAANNATTPHLAVETKSLPVATHELSLTKETKLDAFAALDSAETKPSHLANAEVRQAEAGFRDPELGWVSVRAESNSYSGVHALVTPDSEVAARVLSTHMEGLHQHLREQNTFVATLTVGSPHLGQQEGQGGGGRQPPEEGRGDPFYGNQSEPGSESAMPQASPISITLPAVADLAGSGRISVIA